MKNFCARLARDESGTTSMEYSLIAVLVAVVIISAVRVLGSQVNANFNSVEAAMKSA